MGQRRGDLAGVGPGNGRFREQQEPESTCNHICSGATGRGYGRCAIGGPLADDAIGRHPVRKKADRVAASILRFEGRVMGWSGSVQAGWRYAEPPGP